MILAAIAWPVFSAWTIFRRKPRRRVDFMDENIHAASDLHQRFAWPGVPGNHYRAIRRVDAITEGVFPRAVLDRDRIDTHAVLFVNNPSVNLMHIDAIAPS